MYLQLKTLFFFCLHFLQKGKRNHKLEKKNKNLFPCAKAHLCMSVLSGNCLFVTDANKKELGSLCPWKIHRGWSMLSVWFSDWPHWPVGSVGRESREKNKMKKGKNLRKACKFRQETGEWFELDAVWAIWEWYWLIRYSWWHLKRRRRKVFLENVLPHPPNLIQDGEEESSSSPRLGTGLSCVASEERFRCVCVSLHSFLYLIVQFTFVNST